jgi:D-xylose transport system substrate-binding protein
MGRKTLAMAAAGVGITMVLAGCGNNSSPSTSSGGTTSASAGAGAGSGSGVKVGVILPDTETSVRWESFDRPLLTKALTDAGVTPIIDNAQGDTNKFSSIADSMINQGVKALLIVNLDSASGAAVEQKAKQAGIVTIDYDRLTLGGSADYYVSFDNVKVGALQGQGLLDCLGSKQGANIIEIEGSPTDNNATLFYQGQQSVLKPKYDSGTLKLVASQRIEKWNNQLGGTTFEQFLTGNGGKVDGVVAANDGMAGAVVTVLQKYSLNGKVPVTGQDATADSLAAILRGDQCMTVFKPVAQEAASAAKLAISLVKGDKATADSTASTTVNDPEGKRDVKSVLLDPKTITKTNVGDALNGGLVNKAQLCTGAVAQLCTQAGIS